MPSCLEGTITSALEPIFGLDGGVFHSRQKQACSLSSQKLYRFFKRGQFLLKTRTPRVTGTIGLRKTPISLAQQFCRCSMAIPHKNKFRTYL